jgi:RNA polymerase sigma-70 factor (ECF subfamily)
VAHGETALVELLRTREQAGMDALLKQHGPLMRYIIRPILESPQEREECLSDVAMLVWEKIDSYAPEKGSFEAWLSALTRNTALNRRRGLLRQETVQIDEDENQADDAPGPEELLLKQEQAQRVRAALGRLDAQEKALFYRKYYYLQSTAQIAAEMGLTPRAVEGRLRRLRLRLRKELGGARYE